MTTVEEASAIIQSTRIALSLIQIPISEAVGRVLQENILADRDFPPFNRVAMDGIAINFNQVREKHLIEIEDLQYAGQPQKQVKGLNNCLEVMTGAVLPLGCDTVIKYEDIEMVNVGGKQMAKLLVSPKRVNENVHKQGSDRKIGEVLVQKGKVISPAEVAVAATVGKVFIKVSSLPKIALISTGDELVDPATKPLAHQIRKSNTWAIKAALKENQFDADDFHLLDDKTHLFRKLNEILELYDVLILSGGVSMGKADYVPYILEELGVTKRFHKVAQRPGKPFWFGEIKSSKIVFALPGNPVSTFMVFYKYCLPWLQRQTGKINFPELQAELTEDVSFSAPLTYFLQVKAHLKADGKLMAKPYSGKGSGDLVNLTECDGFLELSAEESNFKAGNSFPITLFRRNYPF
ncbi:MAG: molybdopterin molybdotransferase MoeA [Bacteroidota bacterium]|nr:molybdopterin molybdotransferase MoeA [Bacteroidota bacterium]